MAIVSQIKCTACGREASVCHSASEPAPEICSSCQEKIKNSKKNVYLRELQELSLEQRIAKIEEYIYDLEHSDRREIFDLMG